MPHKLRLFREQNKLSCAAVAAAVGVTRASISRIEQGLQTPSLELMFRLVAATDGAVTANDFMSPAMLAAPAQVEAAE